MVAAAVNHHLPIITEVELASQITDAEIIGVTGSNGKTTTVTMITEILNQERKSGRAYAAGNIGISATETAKKASADDTIVMELSSFMLLGIKTLHPHVAVLTNIFSNHLDYHKTRENYVNAKMRITMNQTPDDFFVVNFDSEEWRQLSHRSAAKVVPFARTSEIDKGAYEKNGKLYYNDEFIMNADDIKVPGKQNVENALAAIACAKVLGKSNLAITNVLETFTGHKFWQYCPYSQASVVQTVQYDSSCFPPNNLKVCDHNRHINCDRLKLINQVVRVVLTVFSPVKRRHDHHVTLVPLGN